MPAEVFFDTSILVYLLATVDPRTIVAQELLAASGTISVQVLNEFAAVAKRKTPMTWPQIEEALADIRLFCEAPVVALTTEIHESAIHIVQRFGFHIYDSVIVASAIKAGCTTLYSEDMQHNQIIETLTIRNPFLRR